MKVIPFPQGTKPWRFVVPPKISPTGKTRAYYFTTKEEAEKKLREVKARGTLALMDMAEIKTQTQIATDARHWQYLVDTYGLSQKQIAAALEREAAISKLKPSTVEEAIVAFQASRTQMVKSGKGKVKKMSTVESDRDRLRKFAQRFLTVQISDIGETEMRDFFNSLGGNNNASIYKSVNVFFNWARDNRYVDSNPLERINRKDQGDFGINNEFYPVETFRRMLRVAAGLEAPKEGGSPTKEFIDLLPWFVISGFGGLRNCEAYRLKGNADALRWTDLHFDVEAPRLPNIEIRDEVAKRTRRKGGDQHYVDFEPAIAAIRDWFGLCPQYKDIPFIVRWTKRNIQDLKLEFKMATGIRFLENGFRNSFATYATAYNGESGLGQIARNMGDLESTVKRHYHRNIPTGTGKAWFGLRPFETVQIKAKTG